MGNAVQEDESGGSIFPKTPTFGKYPEPVLRAMLHGLDPANPQDRQEIEAINRRLTLLSGED
jgi:hypothetical protein